MRKSKTDARRGLRSGALGEVMITRRFSRCRIAAFGAALSVLAAPALGCERWQLGGPATIEHNNGIVAWGNFEQVDEALSGKLRFYDRTLKRGEDTVVSGDLMDGSVVGSDVRLRVAWAANPRSNSKFVGRDPWLSTGVYEGAISADGVASGLYFDVHDPNNRVGWLLREPAKCVAAAPSPEAAEAGMEDNTDRPGSDFDKFHINDQRPDRCQMECLLRKDRCKAWTYVRASVQHEHGVCYLKHSVPKPVPNKCCISGVLPDKSLSSVTETPRGFAPAPGVSSRSSPATREPPAAPSPAPPQPGPPSSSGAGEPYGAIGNKYAGLGGAGGPLGPPTGKESGAPHGGRCHQFQQGMICWHPQIGEAFGVWGMIYAKWAQKGRAEFGYPITDERVTIDGRGRYNHFRSMQHPNRPEASIFWSPQTGAHAIYGAIRDAWAQQGWERGPLGYPTSDEYQDGKYRRVDFERGLIRWSPDAGIESWKND